MTFLYRHPENKFNSNFPEELKFNYDVDNFSNLMSVAHKNTFYNIINTVIRNDYENLDDKELSYKYEEILN